MLKILRKHSKHWLIAAAVGAIVVVFIFWGIETRSTPQSQELARVYGKPIPLTVYYQYVTWLEKKARFRRNLSEEEVRALRDSAPDNLIRLVLLTEKARRLGLSVTDQEVQAAILGDPDFHQDNAFDPRLYELFIGRGRQREADKVAYERWLRQQLLAAKALEAITAFAKISDLELREYFRLSRETVEVRYLEIDPDTFLSRVKPTDTELQEFYERHQEDFRAPEKVKVRYVLLRPEDFRARVEITDREIHTYVRENPGQFTRPKVIRVRELVLPLEANAGPAERRRVEERAQALLQEARRGADFAQLARRALPEGASRRQGAEVLTVTRGQKGESWDKVAFALEPGQAGLARTGKGFHLLKLEEIVETEPLPEALAQARARELLMERQSRLLARREARELQAETARMPFEEAVRKRGLSLQETPFLSQVEAIPGLGPVKAFSQEAFSLKPREVGVAELPQGYAVLEVVARQAPHTPPLEQVKEQVQREVSRRAALKLAEQEAEKFLQRLRQGEPLPRVAAEAGLAVKESGPFTRLQGFQNQPLAEPLTKAAFLLSERAPLPDKPLFWKGKYYLLVFKTRRPPPEEEFQKERQELARRLLEEKRQVLLQTWFQQEWQRAQVTKTGSGT